MDIVNLPIRIRHSRLYRAYIAQCHRIAGNSSPIFHVDKVGRQELVLLPRVDIPIRIRDRSICHVYNAQCHRIAGISNPNSHADKKGRQELAVPLESC